MCAYSKNILEQRDDCGCMWLHCVVVKGVGEVVLVNVNSVVLFDDVLDKLQIPIVT